MTISSEQSTQSYSGDGSTVTFPYGYQFFALDEVKVELRATDGTIITPIYNGAGTYDYTVSGTFDAETSRYPNGGSVTFNTAPPSGYTIALFREVTLTQETDYVANDAFPAETHENALDKLTMIAQQLRDDADKSLRFTATETADPTVPAIQSGWVLGASGDGTGVEWIDPSSLVAEDLTAAEASATAAEASATAAEASATAAESAKDDAIEAAEAAGVSKFYDTKADADADVINLQEGDIVEIFRDEGYGDRRTRYRVESGSLVFLLLLPSLKEVYVDSVNGDDANSGRLPDAPKQSLAAATAILPDGGTLYLRRGSRWHEQLDTRGSAYASIRAYGQGHMPIIDGSRPIPAGAWTPDPGGRVGVYYADISVEFPVGSAVSSGSNMVHAMMWEEEPSTNLADCTLDRFMGPDGWEGQPIDLAANLDYLEANPGSFTFQILGDDTTNPTSNMNPGGQYRYWLHVSDGSDPSSSGKTYYYAERARIAWFGEYTNAQDLLFQRTANKDGSTQNGGHIRRCAWRDMPMHAAMGGGATFEDCDAVALPSAREYGGGGFHQYWNEVSNGGPSSGFLMRRCKARGFATGFYCHGQGTGPQHNAAHLEDLTADECAIAVSMGNLGQGLNIDGLQALRCLQGIAATAGDKHIVRRFKYVGELSMIDPPYQRALIGADFDVTDSVMIFDPDGGPDRRGVMSGSGDFEIRLTRCTVVNGGLDEAEAAGAWSWYLDDCIIGQIAGVRGSIVSATNTMIQVGTQTIEELAAAHPGVDTATCVSAWNSTTFQRTIITSDTQTFDHARTASGTLDSDIITFNFADADTGRVLEFQDYDGAGGTFRARVLEMLSTGSNGQARISVTAPATFSNKALKYVVYARETFPAVIGNVEVSVLASESKDQIRLIGDLDVAVGSWIHLRGFGRHPDLGTRKVTAINGEVATLDRPYILPVTSRSTDHKAIDGSGNGISLPQVQAEYGLELRKLSATVQITYVEGGTSGVVAETARGQFTGVVTRGNVSGGALPTDNLYWYDGHVEHAWNVIEGDIVTFDAVVKIPDLEPQYVADPLMSGRADLVPGSYLAQKRMGARG